MLIIDREFIERWCSEYDRRYLGTKDQREEAAILNWLSEQDEPKFLNKKYFIRLGRWKTSRYAKKRKTNAGNTIIEKTRCAYLEKDDLPKLKKLKELKGVGVAVASTILYFLQQENFPIFDYHARETLKKAGRLSKGKEDDSDKVWLEYTRVVRELSSLHNKTIREVEKALFAYDKWGIEEQEGEMQQSEGLEVKLPKQKMQQLEILADEFGVDPATLARFWILERLLQIYGAHYMPSATCHKVLSEHLGPQVTTKEELPKKLRGYIVSQSQTDPNHWLRREICVFRDQEVPNYPRPEREIILVDSTGKRFQEPLNFIKTEKLSPKRITLGVSKELKSWFINKGYPKDRVNTKPRDYIYLQWTGNGVEYMIHTEAEWQSKK